MRLVTLSADGFRNLKTFRVAPHPRFNILEGRNGQGKTNFLEAVYLLAAFGSFRNAQNRQLVAFGGEKAVVYGEIDQRGVSRSVEVTVTPKGKKVALDGKKVTRLPDELAHLNVVVFGPDDLSLTKGNPAQRRAFLDRAVYAVWPEYIREMRAFTSALKSRNQLLRQAADVGLDADVVAAFEASLVRHGAQVVHRRRRFVETFRPHFERAFTAITGGELSASLRYRGFSEPSDADVDAIAACFQQALDASRDTDMRRGFTSQGPQTHDLTFQIDRRSVRIYASQGQHRAFVLALKMAELERIREAIGTYPVFLLDDVSSELDEARNAHLMRYIDQGGGQVFITTTDRRWIQVTAESRVYRVADGVITALDDA